MSQLTQVKALYDRNYGFFDRTFSSAKRRVKMPHQMLFDLSKKENTYIALAMVKTELVGYAIYYRFGTKRGAISIVIQLVVGASYRRLGIGTRLLFSAWGFSNDKAWGIITSNPFTIRTLESATMRHVKAKIVHEFRPLIQQCLKQMIFFTSAHLKIDSQNAKIDSKFYVDQSNIRGDLLKAFKDRNWQLGSLNRGEEWLAFTFQGQPLVIPKGRKFLDFIEFSEQNLREAYQRMKITEHGWARHAAKEVNQILELLVQLGLEVNFQRVADFGCGIGRHSIAMGKLGHSVIGIDYGPNFIQHAEETRREASLQNVQFKVADIRSGEKFGRFNLILCLYDVIGSFPKEGDNERIILNIRRNLARNGVAVISTMNKALTLNLLKKTKQHIVHDLSKKPMRLMRLKPSNTMQASGNVFDPKYILYEKKTDTFYRKEQFRNDGLLSAEYLIRDRRYTLPELTSIFNRYGLEVIHSRYVQAGRFNSELYETHPRAKELLIIVRHQ
ncbi:Methyltransferase type 12 [Turneriella parva DSM 21527]|uniref:Methyltransferase type 12 n=2 Tax=Turneriella TaxID=338321 RepID=I4B1P6_TURPD|nr:Methyltransferase type 12 [Turneriella parva DSM 21527]